MGLSRTSLAHWIADDNNLQRTDRREVEGVAQDRREVEGGAAACPSRRCTHFCFGCGRVRRQTSTPSTMEMTSTDDAMLPTSRARSILTWSVGGVTTVTNPYAYMQVLALTGCGLVAWHLSATRLTMGMGEQEMQSPLFI